MLKRETRKNRMKEGIERPQGELVHDRKQLRQLFAIAGGRFVHPEVPVQLGQLVGSGSRIRQFLENGVEELARRLAGKGQGDDTFGILAGEL